MNTAEHHPHAIFFLLMNFSHLKSPSGFQLLQMGTLLEKTKMSLLKEKKQLFRLMVLLFFDNSFQKRYFAGHI